MDNRTGVRAYGKGQRFFHWSVAALILAALGLGLYASNLPRGGAEQVAAIVQAFSWHKTVGVAVLLLALARIVWRLTHPQPAPLHPERRAETLAAETVHDALYLGMVVMPLTGWLLHSAAPGEGFARILWPFGQRLPGVPQDAALSERFASFHETGWWLLAALIVLHVGAVIKHALIDRDATMTRMAGDPAKAPVPPTGPRPARWIAGIIAVMLWAGVWVISGTEGDEERTAPPPAASVSEPAGTEAAPVETQAAPATAATSPVASPAGVESAPAAHTPAPALPAAAPAEAAPTASTAWAVQEGTVGISVQQSGAPVTGSFGKWSAQVTYDEATGTGKVRADIDIASLTLGAITTTATGPEFLNAAAHPTATFEGAITREGAGPAHVAEGTLTIAGQAHAATLPFELTIDGATARAKGTLTIDRRDYGVGTGYPDESTAGFPVAVTVDLTATRS